MIGWQFTAYVGQNDNRSPFERLLDLFKEILLHTSGDVEEAMYWLTMLDREHQLTTDTYGIADFFDDLLSKGWITKIDDRQNTSSRPTHKLEIALRRKALSDIFSDIKKTKSGDHDTSHIGKGREISSDSKPFEFGDRPEDIELTASLRNAQINHGIDQFMLTQNDLEVKETYFQSQSSTVLLIDLSHSMILYGEDRITPAKRVALALSELIMTRYPKDTLDIVVFGNDAWRVSLDDLPYLKVGPYHTNTVAGLEMAIQILRKRRNPNKQIMMITDGKPSCIKIGKKYYKNSFGLDQKIVRRTLSQAHRCKKLGIPITTFMIARDPYLMQFIDQFTSANNGKAFFSGLDQLGSFVFYNYKQQKGRKNS